MGWNVDFLVYIVQRSPTQSFVFCQITYYAQYLRSIVDRWMDGFGASLIGWLLLGTFFYQQSSGGKKSSGGTATQSRLLSPSARVGSVI